MRYSTDPRIDELADTIIAKRSKERAKETLAIAVKNAIRDGLNEQDVVTTMRTTLDSLGQRAFTGGFIVGR